MADEVIVDALPYIDHGYDDVGVRESALAMVEEECRRYRPTKNYLDHLPLPASSPFETPLMINEFERIQNRLPMETLSMKRYELPPPPSGKLSEVSAWQESIENSMAQLEHQWVRSLNLELMLDYGTEAWKSYLEVFTAMQAKAQIQLQQLKKDMQDVNWQRKQAQTQAGEKLRNLEAHWVLLVSKNYEIETECVELEKVVQAAREQLEKLAPPADNAPTPPLVEQTNGHAAEEESNGNEAMEEDEADENSQSNDDNGNDKEDEEEEKTSNDSS
ncbi:pre-mRNA-splicing factor SPF27 isoform X2 [Drosophila sulfurigaster albostrigata]|uniref:pre-mRNA-splicing factor SPF27 isoform X2 n=1 Tax=Drosophila sulfurigaster albostrigata TaxID=89887 RepID=UPI002D21D759|nr:pre-mRNA-splicing factor SPF27 isoform X2 [Drosophila sulfurigaster albostrigata]